LLSSNQASAKWRKRPLHHPAVSLVERAFSTHGCPARRRALGSMVAERFAHPRSTSRGTAPGLVLKALLAHVLPKPKRAGAHAEQTPLQRATTLAAAKQWEALAGVAQEILHAEPENLQAILLHARSFRARGLLEQAQQAY